MTGPIEAVVWDYGGVISTPPFRGIDRFESDLGYPPGSVLELIFGERAYVGALADGTADLDARSARESVTHDWHRLEIGELSIVDYMNGVIERAPDVLGQPIDFEAYRAFMRDMPIGVHWLVVHRIRELRSDGLQVALLTNNVKEFGEAWRSTFPVDELFEVVVDSSHVGMRKPDPRIYRLTCERIGVDPTAAVFLDDNLGNVLAARELGMEAIHFVSRSPSQAPAPAAAVGEAATAAVADTGDDPRPRLAELDAILERRGTRAR